MPWPVLNGILEQHRLEPPRLRLTREGKSVPSESYLSYQSNSRRTSRIPRLNAAALTRELRAGATLVLDAVDELHRPITRIADSLERVFRVRVQVNMYAGWRTSHGFDLHWDDHDVFILQVAGRKHWKVYGMTRKYPLARDVDPTLDPPDQVLWEGMLNDGDLLYIPRGWWHVAMPLDEPTLHLTVGVNNPTGADLLSWYVDRLRAEEDVRRDLPHLSGPEACRDHLERLREILLREWQPDLIERYLADMDAKAKPRPRLSLPWTATESVLPATGYRVAWGGSRGVPVIGMNGQVAVEALGRRWKFAAAAGPLLELLVSGREVTDDDLLRTANGSIDAETIRSFVRELIDNGLVVLR